MSFEEHIGENIREVRLDLGLSQQALADKCGFSNTILSQYENGKKIPSLVTISKIASELHVSIDRLYYGDENNAFITAVSDDGRKIVNSIYLLWSKGVIWYYENYAYDGYPFPNDRYDKKVGVYLVLKKYQEPIRRLLNSLDEFNSRRDTYQDPDAYLEMLMESVAAEINIELEKDMQKEV